MTAYEYDNMPDEFNTDALPEALFDEAFHALGEALSSGAVLAREAKAAYVLDRKGYISLDNFGKSRRGSYATDTDDVVLQITVRVPNPKHNKSLAPIADLADAALDLATQAEREQLEAEIAAAEAAAARAEEEARQKRERLNALRSK